MENSKEDQYLLSHDKTFMQAIWAKDLKQAQKIAMNILDQDVHRVNSAMDNFLLRH